MATIHVARDGTNIGTFSAEEVEEGLRTGQFLPTDLGWEAGMPDWRPLPQIVAAKPAGATPISAELVSAIPGEAVPDSGLPWEHRRQLGFFKAYFDTVVLVLTKPGEAFALMKKEGDLMGPLLFALIGGSAGLIVSILFQIAFSAFGIMQDQNGLANIFGMGLGLVAFIVLVPLFLVVGMFIASGVLHLCLMIVGGAKKPFETTFRVVCFSAGSTYLLSMIPFCGGMITLVWNIVLEIIGIARSHEIETGKAVLAVLLPMIVCCGVIILFAILGGFSALSLLPKH